jgi:hypothetical protein
MRLVTSLNLVKIFAIEFLNFIIMFVLIFIYLFMVIFRLFF